MTTRMKCLPCKRTFRVPNTDEQWTCKQCGEPLVPVSEESDEDRRKQEVRKANAEVKRWRKRHRAFKAYLLIGPGILFALQAAVVGIVLLSASSYMPGLVFLAVAACIAGITWYLSWLSDQKPALASLCFAGLTTLSMLGALFALGGSVRLGFSGVICALSWLGVAQARRVERMRATLPEIYRRKHGLERAQLQGESVREQRQASSRKRSARDRRRIVLLLGGFAVVAAVGGTAFWYSQQPSDPAPTLQAFKESWASNDVDGFAAHASSERMERGLRRFWKREGWGSSPPALIGWDQTERTKDEVLVSFLVEGGQTSKTRWEWHGERWALYAFTTPK